MRRPIQNPKAGKRCPNARLPKELRPIFWEYDFSKLRWPRDRELVIARVLESGSWDHVQWLRAQLHSKTLRQWIEKRHGRGLNPQQLRFWELVLRIPRRRVDAWLREPARQVWDRRTVM